MRLFPDPPASGDVTPLAEIGTPESSQRHTFTRRQVLRYGLIGGTLVLLPGGLTACGNDHEGGATPSPTNFLDSEERRVLRALTGRIVPTDDLPGALECGADEYINRLLSIVPDSQDPVGQVFAGGPFSDRNPFPDAATGTPSDHFPTDSFEHFIPLTRLQLMSWRVQLLGSAAVAGSDFNSGTIDPVVGIRDQYRAGLAGLQAKSQQMFAIDFDAATPAQQDMVLAKADSSFVDLVTRHVLEGMFCPPEYGGNRDQTGWKLIGYDGDSQPLGYSIFDASTQSYRERTDKPNSTANPDESFTPFDSDMDRFLRFVARLADPMHFP
ncbi:MAG: gluconate 2-dehydrogenase subunit 3 family protein [Deltaproteobacteria bacterium]|nr:gluconate 2-dehydrogenase subunit 3 family protein [Deltaproteobacteria bacterium]